MAFFVMSTIAMDKDDDFLWLYLWCCALDSVTLAEIKRYKSWIEIGMLTQGKQLLIGNKSIN